MPTRRPMRGRSSKSSGGTGRFVHVAITVPHQIQARARPELDEVEPRVAAQARELEEAREQDPAPLHLVRLHRPIGNGPREEIGVFFERPLDVAPRRPAAQDERMQPAKKAQRCVPRRVGAHDGVNSRVVGKPPTQLRVKR